jgi:hypothetical protein
MRRRIACLIAVLVSFALSSGFAVADSSAKIVHQVRPQNLSATVGHPPKISPPLWLPSLLTPKQGLLPLFTDGFEGAFPGSSWTLYGNPTWGLTAYRAFSGSRSISGAAGGPGAIVPPANYPHGMDAWAVYGPFNLANATKGEVSLQVWADLPVTTGDFLYYGFSNDDVNYSGNMVSLSTAGWEPRQLNMNVVPGMIGVQGFFAMRFFSNATQSAEGVYVDDVFIATDHQSEDTYELSGVVRDHFGQPMPGAAVSYTPGSYVYTDFAGRYSVRLPNGNYLVQANRAGFQFNPAQQAVIINGGPQGVSFDGTPRPGDGIVKYHAVIVGIADYAGSDRDLTYPDDDAQDLRAALLAGGNWQAANITMLLNAQGTKTNIRNAINAMIARADGDDVCLLYLSGHGTQAPQDYPPIDEPDGLDEIFLTYDLTLNNAIIDDELGLWFSSMPTEAYGVIVDTCNSGGHIRRLDIFDPPPTARRPSGGQVGTQDLDDNLCGVVITSCRDNELAQEDSGLQNGIFTHYFCEALGGIADTNRDGWVSLEEAWAYARPRAMARNPNQTADIWDGYPGELNVVKQETLVSGSTPSAGITGYRRSGTITLNFRWRVAQGTVESRFLLTDASGRPVTGSFTWPTAQRQMVFQPTDPLRADERYTVTMQAGTRRNDGTVVRHNESFNFTTGTEPVVVVFGPTGNNVPRNANITATFDFPMHKQSMITNANFSFSPEVPFVLKTLQGGLQAMLDPTGNLAANTTYTVTMRPACRSVDGRTLAYLKTWTFTTGTTTSTAALVVSGAAVPARGEASPVTVQLSTAAEVTAVICNLAGREVTRVPAGLLPAGVSTLVWNGRNAAGLRVPAGTYLVRLEAVTADGNQARCLIPLQRRP